MKQWILVLGGIFFSLHMSGQVSKCGTSESDLLLRLQDSAYAHQRELIEEHTRQVIAQGGAAARDIITIPVVFHVVYQSNQDNVPDAQLLSQLEVLNEDFRMMNSNFESGTPAVFKPLAADIQIEFCLAVVDPHGNPSPGITRTPTNVFTFNVGDNKVKFDTSGGKNGWPPDKYLNIWVCDLASPVLGYGQFPGGPPETDGIVIAYRAIGRAPANPFSVPYNRGHTAAHEVGHWLNLFHIWGSEANSCTDSDEVGDTPNQDAQNGTCYASPHISCSNGPNGDMFMNYMDYSGDDCVTMFTIGQKQRMHAQFAAGGFRAPLRASTACFGEVNTGGECSDTLRHPFAGTPTLYIVTTPATGYVSGTNSLGDKAKADRIAAPGTLTQLNGALFTFGTASLGMAPANTQITFKAWSGSESGQSPGQVLAQKAIPFATIAADVLAHHSTSVIFDSPVAVQGIFYVGFELNSNVGYTIALYTNKEGESSVNTAWEQLSTGMWVPYSQSRQMEVTHAVFPLLQRPAISALFTPNDAEICAGSSITFTPENVTLPNYHWTFEGGEPAESTDTIISVVYNDPGVYDVTLSVTGECATVPILNEQPDFITINEYPPVPFLDYVNFILKSDITTGYTFRWFRNGALIPGEESYLYKPTQIGSYKLRITKNGCSSFSAPFDIDFLDGIEEYTGPFFLVYPNPADNHVNIQAASLEKMNQEVHCELYDLRGKLVRTTEFLGIEKDQVLELDLNDIRNGMYQLVISMGDFRYEKGIAVIHPK